MQSLLLSKNSLTINPTYINNNLTNCIQDAGSFIDKPIPIFNTCLWASSKDSR